MAIKQCCSLCCTDCSDYKLLQNEKGENNDIYEITVKYFDPMLLTEDSDTLSVLNVLCQVCWSHIRDFHEFQQTVLKSRISWKDKVNSKQLQALPGVKMETQVHAIETNYAENDVFEDSNPHSAFPKVKMKTEDPTIETNYTENNDNYKNDQEDNVFEEFIPNTAFPKVKMETEDPIIETNYTENDDNYKKDQEDNVFEEFIPNTAFPEVKMEKEVHIIDTNYTENDDYESDREDNVIEDYNPHSTESQSASINEEKETPTFSKRQRVKEFDAFIAEWKPELICDICNISTKHFDELRKHFKNEHKTCIYIKCCERKFFQRFTLVNHIQLHLNPEAYKCDICGKASTTKYNLKLHKKAMHEDTKQLKCDKCEKLFKQKFALDSHLLTHVTGNTDFICKECGKGFMAEQLLKRHIRQVHRVCDQCGKTIHGSQAFQRHLLEHAGKERPKFPCGICGIEIKSRTNLKRHKAVYHNDGSTIYVCGVCGKETTSEISLQNHKKQVHLEERKYKCTYCDKAFKQTRALRDHTSTHTGQHLYQCPNCPETFKISASMYQHRKKIHPVEWEECRRNRPQYPKVNINQVKKQVVI